MNPTEQPAPACSDRTTTRLLITVHGIRTFGLWQERLAALLPEELGFRAHHYKYGYYSVVAFLLPFLRWLVTRRFRKDLERTIAAYPGARIDIVAHSFGTHLVAWALMGMRNAPRLRIHTIVFAGSVLKVGFPWRELMDEGTVHRVVNDCGTEDTVLLFNQLFVLFTGMAGRVGFIGMTDAERFMNRYFAQGHSGYFETAGAPSDAFMRNYWLPVLTTSDRPVQVDQRAKLSWLQGLTHFLLNNSEPVKVCLYTLPFVILSSVYFGLWRQAENARQQAVEAMVQEQATSYRQRVSLAHQEFTSNHVDRARSLLAQCKPPSGLPELRRWEWYYLQTLCAEQGTKLDNGAPISSIAWHPQGRLIATAGKGGQVKIWDATNRRVQQTLSVSQGVEPIASWSPDGSRLAISARDSKVTVWNSVTNAQANWSIEPAVVTAIAWTSRGLLATGEYESGILQSKIQLRNPDTGTGVSTLLGATSEVLALASATTGDLLAVATNGYYVDARHQSGPKLLLLNARRHVSNIIHSPSIECASPATSIAWYADGNRLAFGAQDGKVRICSLELSYLMPDGEPVLQMLQEPAVVCTDVVTAVACHSETRQLASSCVDWSVNVLTAEGGQHTLRGHAGPPRAVAWQPRGRLLASAGDDGRLFLWDLEAIDRNPKVIARIENSGTVGVGPIYGMSLSPDGRAMAIVYEGREPSDGFPVSSIVFVDPSNGKDLRFEENIGASEHLEWATDSRRYVLYGGDPVIFIKPFGDGQAEELWLRSLPKPANSVCWRPFAEELAVGGPEGELRLFDTRTGKVLDGIPTGGEAVTCAKWNASGKVLAWGCDDGTIGIWEPETRQVTKERHAHAGRINGLAWKPDGTWLASGGADRVVRLHEISGKHRTTDLDGHTAEVLSVAWSPDGDRLASASHDKTVRIWDPAARQELLLFGGPIWGSMTDVVWSADGRRLFAVESDAKQVWVWDASERAMPKLEPAAGQ